MPKVFISHSWEDNEIARRLARYLKRDGADIWIDYDRISGGDSLPEIISEALDWCDTLVLIWSKSASDSYYVKLEWTSALNIQRRVIPCVIDNTRIPSILSGFLHYNFRDFDSGYIRLARGLGLVVQTGGSPIVSKTKPEAHKSKITTPATQTKFSRRFRSTPRELSPDEVRTIIKKHDFYCKEYDWNKKFSNPHGGGLNNTFELQKNGQVIYDHASGLMWQQSGSADSMYYEKAKQWVEKLNEQGYAGYHDWRLPTLEEAMSLMEPTKNEAGLYIDPLFDSKQRWIWTADLVRGERWAWVVSFGYGGCYYDDLDYGYGYVRAVRSGQASEE